MGRLAIIALLAVLTATLLQAQSDSGDLEETAGETVQIEQETQAERDAWAAEQAELEARYRTAKANVRYLGERIVVESKKQAALEESNAELSRRLEEAHLLQSSLQDTMNVIMARFEDFVARDLPFLPEERERRLTHLRDMLAKPDVTGAEKVRLLFEALRIEAEYGSTVEVNRTDVEVDGEPIFADVLKVGRVSLFWRTPDGERSGTFDPATRSWIELERRYDPAIKETIEMATNMRPIELIALPLGRVQS
jgi:hypothetical protein